MQGYTIFSYFNVYLQSVFSAKIRKNIKTFNLLQNVLFLTTEEIYVYYMGMVSPVMLQNLDSSFH